jgi:hypothetical protein
MGSLERAIAIPTGHMAGGDFVQRKSALCYRSLGDSVRFVAAPSQGSVGAAYDGPVISHRSLPAEMPWVWVANGTRSPSAVFDVPRPIANLGPALRLSVAVDEGVIDSFVDDLRLGLRVEAKPAEDLNDNPGGESPVAVSQPAGIEPRVEVLVLGPVEVSGWKQIPNRSIVTELACYLALHRDRATSGEELRAAIWPAHAREASAKSLRTYMSLLRKSLGVGLVPPGSGTGYRIGAGVVSDWDRFKELAERGAARDDLRGALDLVRGRPFAGVSPSSFGWVFSELLVSEIEVTIVETARRLVDQLCAADDFAAASWAVRQGLRAVPTDYGLWDLRLTIAGRLGRDELVRARRDAKAALGDDASELFSATD